MPSRAMDDRAALLAAVCDRPGDDTPRLVFADYLDDHGDAEYGRFIRAQIELSRVPEWDRRWLHAWHRDHNLFTGRRYRDRFALPDTIRSGLVFRRGFPWGVTCSDPNALPNLLDGLFAQAPVQSVTVSHTWASPAPDAGALAGDPRLNRLRRLGFVQTQFGPTDVGRLADSPHLTGLTEMSFERGALTDAGASRFFRSGLPARLTRLRFHNSPIRPLTRNVLGGPGAMRSLVLSGVSIAGPFLTDLIAAPLFCELVELDLSRNHLGPAGAAALAASPVASALESLTLWETAPGATGVRALAALPNLRRLSLRNCELGPAAAKAIADSPHLRNLTVLDLAGNEISDKGALALAASSHLRNLAELDLVAGGLTDRGVAALLDSPVTAGLVQFSVSGDLSAETVSRVRERFGG